MRRRLLLGALYAGWLVVPLFVWGAGYSDGGGLDGPCVGSGAWSSSLSVEGSTSAGETLLWPPGSVRCVIDGPGGHHERVFPGTGTWIVAGLLVLAPWMLWPLATRMARDAQFNRRAPPQRR